MAAINRMIRDNAPVFTVILLALLVWTQRKSFVKATGGGCGDEPSVEEVRAGRPPPPRRR